MKKERAPRNSKSDPRVSKPTQLKHYSANRIWKNLLQDAKYEYRRHIHTVHAFPERNTKTLTTAGDFLMDIITKYEDNTRNAPLDAGKYFLGLYDYFLILTLSIEYFDKESMSILVRIYIICGFVSNIYLRSLKMVRHIEDSSKH